MAIKRDSNCPLCGARLTAAELIDACSDILDAKLGVLETHCPHCQGYLELLPASGRANIGYLIGTDQKHFDVALSLPFPELEVARSENPLCITLTAPDKSWEFRE